MEEWEKKVMSEIGRELQVIKTAKAERQGFQLGLEKVGEKLLAEPRSEKVEEEIRSLETLEPTNA